MKLATPKNPNTRGLLRERHRRERMQTPPLRTKYPDIASLRLNFVFSDSGPFTPAPQVTEMHPPATAYFRFACPYDDCDGEFDLSGAVEAMVKAERTRCHDQLRCGGQRSGNKGKYSCTLALDFAVEAQRAK